MNVKLLILLTTYALCVEGGFLCFIGIGCEKNEVPKGHNNAEITEVSPFGRDQLSTEGPRLSLINPSEKTLMENSAKINSTEHSIEETTFSYTNEPMTESMTKITTQEVDVIPSTFLHQPIHDEKKTEKPGSLKEVQIDYPYQMDHNGSLTTRVPLVKPTVAENAKNPEKKATTQAVEDENPVFEGSTNAPKRLEDN